MIDYSQLILMEDWVYACVLTYTQLCMCCVYMCICDVNVWHVHNTLYNVQVREE